jgi:ADP-ribose pyrophosphatase YjhB (NUDIX family)
LIRNGDCILSTRRPDHDDELPGVWGLPAGTFRESETLHELIARIGTDKLGVTLTPIRKITEGTQEREAYRLEMELWEAAMEGTPSHPAFQWASIEILEPGVRQGSLCCALALQKGVRLV